MTSINDTEISIGVAYIAVSFINSESIDDRRSMLDIKECYIINISLFF